MTVNADRWKRISDKYGEVRNNGHQVNFVVMRLATHLRQDLVAALGCPDSYVTFFKYEVGLEPSWDKSTKVDKALHAITRGQNGLDFGLGVTLEIGPDTHPKLTLVIPVNVVVGDVLTVETSLTSDRHQIRQQNYGPDVAELAERMYEGLGELLDKWIDGSGCESAWNKAPVFGVIGVQTGPL